jgi:hypothetical protein
MARAASTRCNSAMQRYLCPTCNEVSEAVGASRYAWCSACGQPLSLFDLLPVRPGMPTRKGAAVEPPPAAAAQSEP